MAESLFNNKLLLQYLAAGGQDIAAGNPIGANVNAVTQQNISAQSQAATIKKTLEMLMKMLRGENIPEGGKVTMDNKGVKMDIPSSALGNLSLANEGSQMSDGSGTNWNEGNIPRVFNPFH